MKRRKLLAAAIATLMASSLGAATTLAADHSTGSQRYSINDAGTVSPASAAIGASKTGIAKTSGATSNLEATFATESAGTSCTTGACDDCAPCDVCEPCDDCGVCDDCCGPSLWFVEFEGLAWWRKSRSLPPLLTTSLPGTVQADAGVLGLGTTQVLFGGDNYEDGVQGGGRISFGRWLSADQDVGLAGNFYMLNDEELNASIGPAGVNDILAVPFFNAALGIPDSLLLTFPGVTTNGTAGLQYSNSVLGGDAYVRKLLYAEQNLRVDAIGGYQFARVDEGLTLSANYDDVAGIPNSRFDLSDSFAVKNEFHGGTVGLLARLDRGRWSWKAIAKCGLGNMHQTVDISGRTINTPVAGVAATTPGGLFSQLTNIGSHSNNEFAYIPEGKLNLGYRLTENWSVGVGYSFIYYSDIMTAGAAIDQNVNLTQIPGPLVGAAVPAAPNFANSSDFWVQGANFSLEFAY